MKIIMSGKHAWWVGKIAECASCGCTVELEQHDIPDTYSNRYIQYDYAVLPCPNPTCDGAVKADRPTPRSTEE